MMGISERHARPRRPFVPGWGALPSYLAGREEEQDWLVDRLTSLRACEHSGSAFVFYGPRGNGKTSMLSWVERQARLSGIDVVRLISSGIPSPKRLVEELRPAGILSRLSEILVRGMTFKLRERAEQTIKCVLKWRLRNKPLVLAIDEAHTLSAEVGKLLLPAALDEIAAGAPLLLLLAGTPDLPRHLDSLEASFWERAEILPFGRLSEHASVQAILIPLRDAGWEIEERTAASVARDCQGYPYFLQLRGDSLWRVLPAVPGSVTARDIETSRPKFHARREQFYTKRFRELSRRGLLRPASAVARKFRNREFLPLSVILREIDSSDRVHPLTKETVTVKRVWTELRDLGFVWSASGGRYEPGIPSLMDYVADRAS